MYQAANPPPFNPVLLAGLPARMLPPALLAPLLDAAMLGMRRRHPELFERLTEIGAAVILIDPVDLPLLFLLEVGRPMPRLRARLQAPQSEPSATIRGPLLTLIDLLQGRLDGDSAFFARDLTIEGEMEAVVALRNAIDAAEIDLWADAVANLGPLAAPVLRAGGVASRLFTRAAEDIELMRAAFLAPAVRRLDRQAEEIRELREGRTRAEAPARGAGSGP